MAILISPIFKCLVSTSKMMPPEVPGEMDDAIEVIYYCLFYYFKMQHQHSVPGFAIFLARALCFI